LDPLPKIIRKREKINQAGKNLAEDSAKGMMEGLGIGKLYSKQENFGRDSKRNEGDFRDWSPPYQEG
jgi:hypothetical protein